MVPLHGDTYPIRVYLAGLGGQWDSNRKVWLIPESRIDLARAELARMKANKLHAQQNKPAKRKGAVLFKPRDIDRVEREIERFWSDYEG